MTMKRRTFLRAGTMSVLATGLALSNLDLVLAQNPRNHDPKQDFAVPAEAKAEKTFSYTRDTFSPHVGSTFSGRGVAGIDVELVLVAVRERSPSEKAKLVTKKARNSDNFSLVFRANGELTDLTTIHRLEHPALGEVVLFLTRSKNENDQIFYEAAFNRSQ